MKRLLIILTAALMSAYAFAQSANDSRAAVKAAAKAATEAKNHPERVINAGEWIVKEEGTDEIGQYTKATKYRKNVVATSRFWDNWTINILGGAQFYIGDNDWKTNFGHWIVPAVDLYVNKWISPNFGVGVAMGGYKMKGLYQDTNPKANYQTGEYVCDYKGGPYYRQLGYYIDPQILAWIDLDNLIAGYKANRIWNVAFFAGGGVMIGFDKEINKYGVSFNCGLMNSFRIWKRLHFLINLRGALVSDGFDGESREREPNIAYEKLNIPLDGMFGITAGLSWHFGDTKKKEWDEVIEVTKTYAPKESEGAKAEIAELKNQLDRMEKERKQLEIKNNEMVKIITDPMDLWYHVQFVIDKWDITNREMVNLTNIAKIMKRAPNTRFSLCGYADMQTATPDHNKMLSENRVKQVFKVLTEELGVNPAQLVCDDKGGVDLMFYKDNKLSRCVIIKTIK